MSRSEASRKPFSAKAAEAASISLLLVSGPRDSFVGWGFFDAALGALRVAVRLMGRTLSTAPGVVNRPLESDAAWCLRGESPRSFVPKRGCRRSLVEEQFDLVGLVGVEVDHA